MSRPMGWLGVVRLGLVQSALGAIVVLTTSTLNRVMVVEMALPALLPGLLLGWHYVVQVARPRMGHGADQGRRCTPWILGGMATLAAGGWLAALATVLMGAHLVAGVALALLAYGLIGLGVAASGTSLLTLLAKRVAPERRAAAATTVWILMIVGFVITAKVSGSLLDPFSPQRLLAVAGGVALAAVLVAAVALFRLEGQGTAQGEAAVAQLPFGEALRAVWAEPRARRFTIFVFVSMLAYSMQDLILEPFAGLVFGLTPGATTQLSGTQHGGALVGMLLAAGAGSRWAGGRWGSLRRWTVWGCVASGLALSGLVMAGLVGPGWPLAPNVFLLGLATGAFSIAAIGSMMGLAGAGGANQEGVRMGLWGAAQAQAFALGGIVGTAASDLARWLLASPGPAYALVFVANAALFLVAARLAARVDAPAPAPQPSHLGQLRRAP
ncbi:BCD family MFS transporter [Roseateles puraquae]|uniref:MFS transporter n=1 Tax=Roseateles puraquae TaxID=431059 RepID=A0A254N3L9_9BURK|nr:BCD family MFS transporter [Roseateles puraquae]MDG0855095.1 MFS transporter [Roseateles puraquae]OWR02721.1 MFS transporter [Roseateles puraquae]